MTQLPPVSRSSSRFTILSPLSTGGQSSLFLCLDNETSAQVVLKKTLAQTKEQIHAASMEVSLLRACAHPNIVTAVGASSHPLPGGGGMEICLYMEYCAGGHLLNFSTTRAQQNRPLTELEIVRLFVQACRAVEHLHRFTPPVAHRDVKLENLLLAGDDKQIKLCDFGSTTTKRWQCQTAQDRAQLQDEVERYTTPSYRAPELVDLYSNKIVSEQIDVWALGCVLYALAYRKHAFDDGATLAILNGKLSVPKDPYYSDEFKAYFFWMLDVDPGTRPRIGDVCDDLDHLLGNKVKVTADKRGSGRGDRSSRALQQPHQLPKPSPSQRLPSPKAKPPLSPPVAATAATGAYASPSRGAAFITAAEAQSARAREGAMDSRRGQRATARPIIPSVASVQPGRSTNPFDDLLPSQDPTFFSNPGLSSNSVVGFPTDLFERRGEPNLASQPSANKGNTVSQTPIFFSDPPKHYR